MEGVSIVRASKVFLIFKIDDFTAGAWMALKRFLAKKIGFEDEQSSKILSLRLSFLFEEL